MPATRARQSFHNSSKSVTGPATGRRESPIIVLDSDSEDETVVEPSSLQLTKLNAKRCLNCWKLGPGEIVVGGHVLKTSVAWDVFWYFCAERQLIDAKRRAGLPPPWTEDKTLANYRFTNAFRVADKVSQYLVRHVIEEGSQDHVELVFRVILFTLFTKPETWELLLENLGPELLTWARYDRSLFSKVLATAKFALYTGSFQKPSPIIFGHAKAYENHLDQLEMMMSGGLPSRLMAVNYLVEAYEEIASYQGMAEFTSYQLLLNLSYTSVLPFSGNDFVIAGLGAKSGLHKIFNKEELKQTGDLSVKVMRYMVENQEREFAFRGLQFIGLGPENRPMDLADVEHVVCEVDKYCRKAYPKLVGKSKELRKTFKQSTDLYNTELVLPSAWSQPSRRITKIRPGVEVPRVQKVYRVKAIIDHRDGEKGIEYRVTWWGYTGADDTWEPGEVLASDIPEMIHIYRHKRGLR